MENDAKMPPADAPKTTPLQSTILSMSGLEYLQKMLTGEYAGAPIAHTLNFYAHSVEKGRVVFRGTPKPAYDNPMGGVHGGWFGTILDSCMACAVMSMLPKGSVYTTLEYKINITRTIPHGTLVEAIGTVQHSGRTTGVASGEIRGVEDGKLYATGSTTCLIMQP